MERRLRLKFWREAVVIETQAGDHGRQGLRGEQVREQRGRGGRRITSLDMEITKNDDESRGLAVSLELNSRRSEG